MFPLVILFFWVNAKGSYILIDPEKIQFKGKILGMSIDGVEIPISGIASVEIMKYKDAYERNATFLTRVLSFGFLFRRLERVFHRIMKEDMENKEVLLINAGSVIWSGFSIPTTYMGFGRNNILIYVGDPYKFKAEVEKHVKAYDDSLLGTDR
ncbi:MAG: hypothetical protein D6733_07275 [Methanobacteriota archaeon]|nr:MAG: hypothetical protein D6733_07275 [Euryarchaeota archaeon]